MIIMILMTMMMVVVMVMMIETNIELASYEIIMLLCRCGIYCQWFKCWWSITSWNDNNLEKLVKNNSQLTSKVIRSVPGFPTAFETLRSFYWNSTQRSRVIVSSWCIWLSYWLWYYHGMIISYYNNGIMVH